MIEVVRDTELVLTYVDDVCAMADRAKKAFGFLAVSVYHEHAIRGLLWIALDYERNQLAGYLLFGGKYPHLKVFQLHIKPEYQRKGIGEQLFNELKQFGVDKNYLYISARVAAELDANLFWKRMGLQVIDQIPGRGGRRTLNVYMLELPTNLFATQQAGSPNFEYKNVTQLRNSRYVLDLNIYFDVVKRRKFAGDARQIFTLGLSGRLQLAITEEFFAELERNTPSSGPDPLLELAGAIPRLPDIPSAEKNRLIGRLRADVFPDRSPSGRSAVQDQSDLTHLAICVHHEADGFVTRENAILKKAPILRTKYGLDVISPTELVESDVFSDIADKVVDVGIAGRSLAVDELLEADRRPVATFLDRLSLTQQDLVDALEPGDQGTSKPRIAAKVDGKVVGFLTCTQKRLDSSADTLDVLAYVDETISEAERFIDHFLQLIETIQPPRRLAYISLRLSPKQYNSYQTGLARGYRKYSATASIESSTLCKWSYRGPILSQEWARFRSVFAKHTGLELPKAFPTFSELTNTGIFIRDSNAKKQFPVSLREFETMTSSFLVTPQRPIVIIPIRMGYALQLLGVTNRQHCLNFGQIEAVMRSERAYFSRPGGSKQLKAGAIVLFYVSAEGGGNQAVVGIARVTSARKITVADATANLRRQGVLEIDDLEDIANQRDEVMAVTFDNYFRFPQEIPWHILKSLGCVGGANLVTAQAISSVQLDQLIRLAYKEL